MTSLAEGAVVHRPIISAGWPPVESEMVSCVHMHDPGLIKRLRRNKWACSYFFLVLLPGERARRLTNGRDMVLQD